MTLAFVECNIVGVGVLDFRPEHASTSETRLRALAPGRGVEYANVTAFSFCWRRNDHVEKCVAAACGVVFVLECTLTHSSHWAELYALHVILCALRCCVPLRVYQTRTPPNKWFWCIVCKWNVLRLTIY